MYMYFIVSFPPSTGTKQSKNKEMCEATPCVVLRCDKSVVDWVQCENCLKWFHLFLECVEFVNIVSPESQIQEQTSACAKLKWAESLCLRIAHSRNACSAVVL